MRYKYIIGLSVTFVFVTLISSVSYIFDRFMQPAVASSSSANNFTKACLSSSVKTPLDNNGKLSVAVWNIYKQQNEGWQIELSKLSRNRQLILLQEASLTSELIGFTHSQNKTADIARAFSRFNVVNGVMNIASISPIKVCARLSAEPWIRLAKSALVAYYPLSNHQSLLVINLHSINFAWTLVEYQSQLTQFRDDIKKHKGPVILAGDFNTWRRARVKIINDFISDLGLIEALPTRDVRTKFMGYPLDHLYYRGLKLKSVAASTTQASDHAPLTATFLI